MSAPEQYPDDSEFELTEIAKVTPSKDGWDVTRADGWCFFVSRKHGVEPHVGDVARFYGKGIGCPVRGLYLGGRRVFYRTEEEQKAHSQREIYGSSVVDWLSRWDAGKGVWSISMGGLGPGYEQAIQVTVAELVRIMLGAPFDAGDWENLEVWERDRDAIRVKAFENDVINSMGLSGAQYGAALSLAAKLYMDGPIAVMTNESLKERHIQVSKHFPKAH